jgi:hypothetical protein
MGSLPECCSAVTVSQEKGIGNRKGAGAADRLIAAVRVAFSFGRDKASRSGSGGATRAFALRHSSFGWKCDENAH